MKASLNVDKAAIDKMMKGEDLTEDEFKHL